MAASFSWFFRVVEGAVETRNAMAEGFSGFPGFSGFTRYRGDEMTTDFSGFVQICADLAGSAEVCTNFPGFPTHRGTMKTRWPHCRAPRRRDGHFGGAW